MTTSIYKFDGNLLVPLSNYTLNVTNSPLSLPGKGYRNYDAPIAQNLLWTLQSFARSIAPSIKIQGQVWYDTNVNALRVNSGVAWNSNNGVIVSGTEPISASNTGAFWYDTYNLQLNTWNGDNWSLIAPSGSAANNDPVSNTVIPDNSKIDAIQISDAFGNNHEAYRITIGGTIIAIISKDSVYTPAPAISGFATISPGINLNSLIVIPTDDLTIFRGTQTNYPDSDGHRNLGSPSLSFNSIYANTAIITNQVLVNTTENNYTFEVNGNSLLNGNTFISNTAILSSGTNIIPPVIMSSGSLSTTPPVGSIEFDGGNLYITSNVINIPTRQTIGLGTPIPPGTWGWIFTSNISNTYVAKYIPNQSLPILVGSLITGTIPSTNTSTTVTLQANVANPSKILLSDGVTPPAVGMLVAGHIVQFKWNGVSWLAVADLTAIGAISNFSTYLPLTGGTMIGFVGLPGNPNLNLQVAPKQYVDQQFSLVDNEITGLNNQIANLNVNKLLPLIGGNMTGFPVLPGNPTTALQAAPKQYVDTSISNLNLSSYLQKSGGTMSGPLTLNADPTTNLGAVTKQYVDNQVSIITSSLVKKYTKFTSSGSYTNPGAGKQLLVIVTGGGGGGGSGSTGGGGGTVITAFTPDRTVSSYSVTVGAGGTSGSTGSSGGQSSFGGASVVTAYGGNGGNSSSGQQGTGISGTNSSLNGAFLNDNSAFGLNGGSDGTSFWGDGGSSTIYGSGGAQNSHGANGVVIVMEYY